MTRDEVANVRARPVPVDLSSDQHMPNGNRRRGGGRSGQLKVRGLDGLRVCDASVFPDVVASNIMATVIMVAERGAEFTRT